MPKIKCKCGNVLNASIVPMKEQYLFISDEKMDEFHNQIDAENIYRAMDIFYSCQVCRRLMIFWDGYGKDPEFYVSEGISKDFFRDDTEEILTMVEREKIEEERKNKVNKNEP